MSTLTRNEVEGWPALGPMSMKAERVLGLLDELDDLRAELDLTRAALANAEGQRDVLAQEAVTLRALLDTIHRLVFKTEPQAGDYKEYLKYSADLSKAWGDVRAALSAPSTAAETLERVLFDAETAGRLDGVDSCVRHVKGENCFQPMLEAPLAAYRAAIESAARADERASMKSFHAAWKAEVRAKALREAATHFRTVPHHVAAHDAPQGLVSFGHSAADVLDALAAAEPTPNDPERLTGAALLQHIIDTRYASPVSGVAQDQFLACVAAVLRLEDAGDPHSPAFYRVGQAGVEPVPLPVADAPGAFDGANRSDAPGHCKHERGVGTCRRCAPFADVRLWGVGKRERKQQQPATEPIQFPEDIPVLRNLYPELGDRSDDEVETLWATFSDEEYAAGWLHPERRETFVRWLTGRTPAAPLRLTGVT